MTSTTVVFLHGYTCSPNDWGPVERALGGGIHCVTPLLRGHGGIGDTPGTYGIERCAHDVAHELAREKVSSAVVVGHSMGARIAIELAATHPKLVFGLVLVDGSCIPGDEAAEHRKMVNLIGSGRRTEWVESLFDSMLLNGLTPSSRTALESRSAETSDRALVEYLVSMTKWDTEKFKTAASRVACPVVAIQSTSIDPQGQRHHIEMRPGSLWREVLENQVKKLDFLAVHSTGHFLMLERPGIVVEAIRRQIGPMNSLSDPPTTRKDAADSLTDGTIHSGRADASLSPKPIPQTLKGPQP